MSDAPEDTKTCQSQHKHKWKVFQDATSWIKLRKAQDKGSDFWQTRSKVILFDSVPADCMERVVNTKTKEILYLKKFQYWHVHPKFFWRWQVQRDDPHQRGTSTVKAVADEEKEELKIDFRIQGIPQAVVEQEEDRTRGIKRWVLLIRNHADKSASIEDLLKTDTYNPFSESQYGERGVLQSCANFFWRPSVLVVQDTGQKASSIARLGEYTKRLTKEIRHIVHPVLRHLLKGIAPWCSLWENWCAARISPSEDKRRIA